MLSYLSEHAAVVNVFINTAMLVVWTIYLQIFMIGHHRNARGMLHIDLGGTWSTDARCLVTNLGSVPLYIQGIVADLTDGDTTDRAVLTDKAELAQEPMDDPLARTNRGVLDPGQTMDLGSLEELVHRARIRLGADWEADHVQCFTITIVAVTGGSARLIGAAKTFHAEQNDGTPQYQASGIMTRQLSQHHMRRRVHALLRDTAHG